jgi:hypothetical protein
MLESIFILAFGIDDILVVGKSRRTDKHKAVILNESGRNILFDFVSPWLFGLVLTLIVHA